MHETHDVFDFYQIVTECDRKVYRSQARGLPEPPAAWAVFALKTQKTRHEAGLFNRGVTSARRKTCTMTTTLNLNDSQATPSASPPEKSELAKAMTVLTCIEGHTATKTWGPEGKPRQYDAGWQFKHSTAPCGNIQEAFELFTALSERPDQLLIYDKLRPGLERRATVCRRKEGFERGAALAIILDLDNLPPLPNLSVEETVREARDSLLPPEFHDVACVAQISASTGHPSKGGRIGVHLVFIASAFFPVQQLHDGLAQWSGSAEAQAAKQAWCARAGTTLEAVIDQAGTRMIGLDTAPLRTVQAIYTAAPIIKSGAPADPHAGRRVFRLPGLWGDEVAVYVNRYLAPPRVRVASGVFAPTPNAEETEDHKLVAAFVVESGCYRRGASGFNGAVVSREQWLALARNMRQLGFVDETIWSVWDAIYEGDNHAADTDQAANWAAHGGAIDVGTFLGIVRQAAKAAERNDVLTALGRVVRTTKSAALIEEARGAGLPMPGFNLGDGSGAAIKAGAIHVADPAINVSQTAAEAKRARLVALREKTGLAPPNHEAKAAEFLGWDSDDPPAKTPMLLEGIVPRVGVTALSGASGAGKTFLMAHMAVCLALQRPYFGVEGGERVGILVIAGERIGQLQERFQAARKRLGATALPIAWLKPSAGLEKLDGWEDLAERVGKAARKMREGFGVRLGAVIVDTFGASTELKNENDSSEGAAAMRTLGDVAEALGLSIVVVMHHGKDAEKGMRGASAYRAGFDYHLQAMAQRDPESGAVSNRRVYVEKSTTGPEGQLLGRYDVGSVPLVNADGESWNVGYVEETATYRRAPDFDAGETAFAADGRAAQEAMHEEGAEELQARRERVLKAFLSIGNPSIRSVAEHLKIDRNIVARDVSLWKVEKAMATLGGRTVVTPKGKRHAADNLYHVRVESDGEVSDQPFGNPAM